MILADTGVFVAAADADDKHHVACAALVEERSAEFVVAASVVVEVCWMLERNLGPIVEARFLRSVATGTLAVEPLSPEDYLRASELVEMYADLRLGMVDASVVALAERLGVTTVATVNPRDFTVVRPRHVDASTLLPLIANDPVLSAGVRMRGWPGPATASARRECSAGNTRPRPAPRT